MTVLSVISENCTIVANSVNNANSIFSVGGLFNSPKINKKPNLTGAIFSELAKLIQEGMNYRRIKATLAVIEQMPDYADIISNERVRPIPLIMNTDNLDKSDTEAMQLHFWNQVLSQGKPAVILKELPNFSQLSLMLQTNFDVSDFQGQIGIASNHRNLRNFHYILSPKQVVEYKKNSETNSIQTQVIAEYSQSLINLSVAKNKAYVDFQRSIALQGYVTKGKSHEDISVAIKTFVVGNRTQSQLSEFEGKIIEFLSQNGGQEINRCFELEMMITLRLKDTAEIPLNFGHSSGTQVWKKDANGSFYCDLTQEIYCLKQGMMATICLDSNQKALVLHEPELADKYAAQAVLNRSPILKGEFRVRLEYDLENKLVVPVVESMCVMAQDITLLTHPNFLPVSTPQEEVKKEVVEAVMTTTSPSS